MPNLGLFLRKGLWSLLSLGLLLLVVIVGVFILLESQLPDVATLREVQLQVPLRVYSADGVLITEFGEMRRIPVSVDKVPKLLINGLLATEDQRFYEHPGVDMMGLGRAAIQLIKTGEKSQGGSTITMQVARNYFLNKKKTYMRKLNEILLAIKIDHNFSKEKILDLYLNVIFMGYRAYGVAAASQVYYGKDLSELTLPEMAMLAGLPQAPSAVNPISNPEAAIKRRNHVLLRMYEEKYIDKKSFEQALKAPLTASYHGRETTLDAPYVAEMARQEMVKHYGDATYTKGLQVYTTVNSKLQEYANLAVRKAILDYDRRHGYRGAENTIDLSRGNSTKNLIKQLKKIPVINHLEPAIVLSETSHSITVLKQKGETIEIPWAGLSWARSVKKGIFPKQASDIVKRGDVIRITKNTENHWELSQIPDVEGALVSMDPKTGAIQALVGGFAFEKSKFNRAVQALRQPGSSIKPFIYAAALEHGYTLASVINDAPVVFDDPTLQDLWRPQNATKKFYGPTRLRVGLANSRNVVSIRLLQDIGIPYTRDYLAKLGFNKNTLPDGLSLALGTLDINASDLASKYAIFANGGYKIDPYIVQSVRDLEGKEIERATPIAVCADCETSKEESIQQTIAPRVMDAQVNYLMNLVLRDVIERGTGQAAKVLGRQDLAGKTGTTQDHHDGWFAGFNGNMVTIAWMGFDQLQSLHEYAHRSTLPMWIDYMRLALANTPETPLIEPQGMMTVRIDPKTGLLARPDQTNGIYETFRAQNVPKQYAPLETNTETEEPLF